MTRAMPPAALRLVAALGLSLAMAGCAVGPDYQRPEVATPPAFKEATTVDGIAWLPAAPADALARGPWWELFGDEPLNALAAQVSPGNFDVAAALASYRQARAVVGENRALRYPTVGAVVDGSRTGGRRTTTDDAFSVQVQASWAPDLWGRLGRAVEAAEANAQASAADVAAARLSAQGALATAYFSLREADAEIALLERTIVGYQRSLSIAQNRYSAGIVARTDVLQAQTQLSGTQADLSSRRADRARFEHAIAVLVGKAPAEFALAAAPWKQDVPAVPVGLPSTLLERRPDIAAAERDVAAANAQIGVARSAWFPSLTINASAGSVVADLLKATPSAWSIGATLAQTVFDAGAIRSRVQQAEAGRDVATARYRQTVITAFQEVEDRLVDARALAEQQGFRRAASDAADLAEQQIENRYRAGQVSYTEVVTAQASALSARRALVLAAVNRQTTAVALIQALGGGWAAIETP